MSSTSWLGVIDIDHDLVDHTPRQALLGPRIDPRVMPGSREVFRQPEQPIPIRLGSRWRLLRFALQPRLERAHAGQRLVPAGFEFLGDESVGRIDRLVGPPAGRRAASRPPPRRRPAAPRRRCSGAPGFPSSRDSRVGGRAAVPVPPRLAGSGRPRTAPRQGRHRAAATPARAAAPGLENRRSARGECAGVPSPTAGAAGAASGSAGHRDQPSGP
jgi:hypothetical protein